MDDQHHQSKNRVTHSNAAVIVTLLICAGSVLYLSRDCQDTSYQATRGAGQAVSDLTKEQLEVWRKTVEEQLPKSQADAVSTIADVFHDVTRVADEVGAEVLPLTIDDEIKLGKLVHERVLDNHPVLNDANQQARLERLARPLLQHSERPELTYTFTVIDSDAVNAFTHLGGYIYVYRGLLEAFRDDAAIQFVLGHEMGHCELKHVLRGQSYSMYADRVGGRIAAELVDLAYRNVAVGYSEYNEFQADLWAYDTMRKCGPKQG